MMEKDKLRKADVFSGGLIFLFGLWIISQGFKRATFLPQVWKQLPSPSEFLNHLCMKAGLPADTWQSANLAVQTYQVISFEEEP